MKAYVCPNCRSSSFLIEGKKRTCEFCGSEFYDDTPSETNIDLQGDIAKLLDKCKKEPWHASLYAGLVLDIDPFNEEAWKYL